MISPGKNGVLLTKNNGAKQMGYRTLMIMA
jgi:hypothetical protein